jgi:phosphopantothenoylcysteine decarboxylase/phosphopantothenate--cysteine ligase
MLEGKKIVIGITGSIAAYKIPFLVRLFIREGAEVRVIMTPAARDFVTPLTLSTLSRNPVVSEPFTGSAGEWNNHVELGSWADLMIFAPVTANTLGKMAHGIADNFLVTAYLSAKCPVFIAPAMDLDMYNHPTTRNNIEILRSFGHTIIEPQTGELASGLSGPGRLEEPERILGIALSFFKKKEEWKGKKILVTAGPTFEKIDPVRFLGNHSSGLMGFSLAEEAAFRGGEVTLITGPAELTIPDPRVSRIDVTSAAEMHRECMKHSGNARLIIMAAAVSDYTVASPASGKIKKTAGPLSLILEPTADILKELGKRKKKNQLLVGFALETGREMENARIKLKEKNLDLVILNSLKDPGAGFRSDTNKITMITRSGKVIREDLKPKREVASDIFDLLAKIK